MWHVQGTKLLTRQVFLDVSQINAVTLVAPDSACEKQDSTYYVIKPACTCKSTKTGPGSSGHTEKVPGTSGQGNQVPGSSGQHRGSSGESRAAACFLMFFADFCFHLFSNRPQKVPGMRHLVPGSSGHATPSSGQFRATLPQVPGTPLSSGRVPGKDRPSAETLPSRLKLARPTEHAWKRPSTPEQRPQQGSQTKKRQRSRTHGMCTDH